MKRDPLRLALVACWTLLCYPGFGGAEEEVLIQDKPLSEWIKQLQSDNRGTQLRAGRALSGAQPGQVSGITPRLLPLLSADRENSRLCAAQILGDYGPPARAAVPQLLVMLQGTQFERNRAAASKALGQILKDAQPSEEVDKVTDALTSKFNEDYDKYSDVRREAVYALGMIGPAAKRCIPKLTKGLTDFVLHSEEHRMVRRASAWTCGRMGPLAAEHIDRLISMMHAEGIYVPQTAEAIGLIGPVHGNVIPNLIDAYEKAGPYPGSWPELKTAVLGALERFGAKSAPGVPMLRRYIREAGQSLQPQLRLGMMKVFAAVGPAAKEAAPEIEALLKTARAQGAKPEEQAVVEAGLLAYKATTGQEAPAAAAKTK